MNEHLKALEEQATESYREIDGSIGTMFDAEKFAELIVRECAKVMEECEEDIPNIWKAVYDVKDHFGIK